MMTNKVIEEALSGFRELLFSEIKEELESTPGHKVAISLELPCTIDEDRYHTETLSAIFLDVEGNIMVESTDDYYGDTENESIDLYSVDQILDIIKAI